MAGVRFELSKHAADAMAERGIAPEWVRRTLEFPARRVHDPEDPALVHALAPIPEFGGRVLRVVYNSKVDPWRVVTAHFDRGAGGKR